MYPPLNIPFALAMKLPAIIAVFLQVCACGVVVTGQHLANSEWVSVSGFLTNPPAVANLAVEFTFYHNPGNPKSQCTTFYQFRCQSNAFFARGVTRQADLPNPPSTNDMFACGFWNTNYWIYESGLEWVNMPDGSAALQQVRRPWFASGTCAPGTTPGLVLHSGRREPGLPTHLQALTIFHWIMSMGTGNSPHIWVLDQRPGEAPNLYLLVISNHTEINYTNWPLRTSTLSTMLVKAHMPVRAEVDTRGLFGYRRSGWIEYEPQPNAAPAFFPGRITLYLWRGSTGTVCQVAKVLEARFTTNGALKETDFAMPKPSEFQELLRMHPDLGRAGPVANPTQMRCPGLGPYIRGAFVGLMVVGLGVAGFFASKR